MNRGEVAIANLRPHDPRAKVRPVLIVQNDPDNARMANTIVVAITKHSPGRRADATAH